MSYSIERANRFVAESKHLLVDQYRLHYHFMGEFGWINDPNGFVQYKGEYHLFYQYHPYQPVWGPMHWGHAVSKDLIEWRHLPVALAPDQEYDRDGCFSGSAIEHKDSLYLLYTGHIMTGPDITKDYYQVQNLAISQDGILFTKDAHNPVINTDQIPAHTSQKDFRDPKVFERNGQFYMVLGSNDDQGKGLILLYRSVDLHTWEYMNVMAQSDGTLGDNWECPDVFDLDGIDVLMMSPQRMSPQGNNYHNLHSTVYMLGKLDTDTGIFDYKQYIPIDYGFDFYACQTTLDQQGRRIMIGWMDSWEALMPTQNGHHWAGAMTLPREVIRDGERLLFRPVAELEQSRLEGLHAESFEVQGQQVLDYRGESYEIELNIDVSKSEEFAIHLRTGEAETTVLSYSPLEQLFRFNRDQSGIGPGGERIASLTTPEGQLHLRIFVDLSSVEVFLQDGEKVMTGRIYPQPESQGIALYSNGITQVQSLHIWNLVQPEQI